jgi:hypothetical protein
VFTKGVAVSIAGCRLTTNCPGFPFIGNLAGRQVQLVCTLLPGQLKHAELLNEVFSTAGKFKNCRKDPLYLDLGLTACVVFKCPY